MRSGGRRFLKGIVVAAAAVGALGGGAPAAQAAALNWDSASYDFGTVQVGSAASKTFTLTAVCDAGIGGMMFPELCSTPPAGNHNQGTVSVAGDGFAIGTLNTCLASLLTPVYPSMVSCQTAVTFTPTSSGVKSGSLTLPNGPDIALSGNGLAVLTAPATKKKKCKKKKHSAAASKKCKKKKK